MAADHIRHHGNHFFKHLSPVLHEQFIARTNTRFITAIQKAEVIADIVRELCLQTGTQHFPFFVAGAGIGALNHNSGANIAKNKVAIAIQPSLMA